MSDTDQPDDPTFYDRHWGERDTSADPHVVAKGEVILRMVPDGVRTVLDVGCGDGYLTRRLATRFDVTGVDRSAVALAKVGCPTIQAGADALPLPDRSFDMVFSSEMLEHLTDDVYAKATRELARVASRYVLLSVPHRETLRRRYARCPRCGLEFHVDGHHRSLDAAALDAVLPGFERIATRLTGPDEPASYAALELVRQRLGRRWWVWEGQTLTCPGCGADAVKTLPRHALHRAVSAAVDRATAAVSAWSGTPPAPYWLLALYRRT